MKYVQIIFDAISVNRTTTRESKKNIYTWYIQVGLRRGGLTPLRKAEEL